MSKFSLKAPFSLYLLYTIPLGAFSLFLLYVGAPEGFFAVLAFILFFVFLTNNVKIEVFDNKLIVQNKYRKQKVIQLQNITSIEPLFGGYVPRVPTALKMKLENGNEPLVALTLFDSKDVHSFLGVLYEVLPTQVILEKLRTNIQKKGIPKSDKKAIVGFSIILIGITGFFVSGFYFDTFGKEIVVHSLQDATGTIIQLIFVLLAFLGLGYTVRRLGSNPR